MEVVLKQEFRMSEKLTTKKIVNESLVNKMKDHSLVLQDHVEFYNHAVNHTPHFFFHSAPNLNAIEKLFTAEGRRKWTSHCPFSNL